MTPGPPAALRKPSAPNPVARLRDVAARAGVSTATVSRVLNNTGTVGTAVRLRVEQACAVLGYVPAGSARARPARRSYTIGAVVPTIENAAFARTVFVLQKTLQEAGLTLLLATTDYDPEVELQAVTRLLNQGVEGLMLIGGEHHSELRAQLEQRRIPFVEGWTLSSQGAAIGFDNVRAAEELTDHLLDLGHRHIAVIAGEIEHNDRAAARLIGVRRSLERRGLFTHSEWLTNRPYLIGEGRLLLRHLLAEAGLKPPTAIICGNDQLAFGVLVEARAHRIAVPRQLSVAGFGDADHAEFMEPPLTTMHVPAQEIGELAAAYLLSRLAGEPAEHVHRVDVRLMARASTAPPPKQI